LSNITISKSIPLAYFVSRIILKDKKKLYIIMEYCENGDMAQLIKKCRAEKDFVAEDVIWKIFM
jgi:NIMA (never in mitosis gene a)-related kinase